MTTLRDLINDFAIEMMKEARRAEPTKASELIEYKNEQLDILMQEIKERLIG